jgi:glycosyltransferase involved in cell wall biosynthesis
MAKQEISVVITVLNEAGTITELLDSLIIQSHQPNKVIVVDAGSTDGTLESIREWKKHYPSYSIQTILKLGVNRSVGRNIGIERAASELIAVTDAGCIAHKHWLKELVAVFHEHPETQSVAGGYRLRKNSRWSPLFYFFLGKELKPSTSDYLPASRSVAFLKSAFNRVGGYPEHLSTCEDLVLAQRLHDLGTMRMAPKALVYWSPPKDLWGFAKAVLGYASGDVIAGYKRHVFKIIRVFGRYILFLIYPIFLILYVFFVWIKFYLKKEKLYYGLILISPLVQILSDVAVMAGAMRGLGLRLMTQRSATASKLV